MASVELTLFPMEPDLSGLNRVKFNSEWRNASQVRKTTRQYVRSLVQKHYLKSFPAVVVLTLVMLVRHQSVGVVIFAMPPRETAIRYGGITWELARLFILDEVPRNAETWLLGKAVRYVRRHHAEVRFLVSYADPSFGHSGTIYRAANWQGDGMTDEGRTTPRSDYVTHANNKRIHRRSQVRDMDQVQRVPRTSKHRYVWKF